MEITLDKWDTAIDSQARAFLLGAREASRLMGDGGRIIAITYAPGGRTGSWQPWGHGSSKISDGITVPLFCRGAGQTQNHS